jgi:CDP-diacylglycerol--glycerol-3-phosphate 3-phosphatidyltransferase
MALSNDSRDRVKGAFEPIALAMGRAGLTPDALTLIGFGITVVGALLISQQHWIAGGLVVFLGGAFDMFDGTLARATGKVSKLGAFMDSVFDRAGEVVVYLGIVAGLLALGATDLAFLAAAALGSAVMVSYTRAKAEGLGFTPGSRMAAIGVMPREVRLVLLSIGLIVAGAIGMDPCECGAPWPIASGSTVSTMGGAALYLALAMITLGSIVTTIQRIVHVRNQARQQASSQPTENVT